VIDEYLERAARSRPGSPDWIEAAFGAGYLLVGDYRLRDLDRAVPLLRAVVEHVEGYHPAYYYLGEALVMLGELDEAEAVLRRALTLDPSQDGIRLVLEHLDDDRRRRRSGPSRHTLDDAARS
jgi:tetratricopeptide (TPR) repeat protein